MMIIEISEPKFEKMAEYTEKMLKYGGKLMSCISEVGEKHGMNFREHDGEHDGYGRYGHPHEKEMHERYPYMGGGHIMYRDYDEDEYEMDERRGRRHRDSMGRYR
jgi:hypothetical protein